MDKNTDPKVVVMDRALCDKLFCLAKLGDTSEQYPGVLDTLRRHVRRFNTAIMEEATQRRADKEMDYRNRKTAAYAFTNRYLGQDVYLYLNSTLITRATVLSRGRRDKTSVYVRYFSPDRRWRTGDKHVFERGDIPITNFIADIPQDWALEFEGYWKGCWRYYKPMELEPPT